MDNVVLSIETSFEHKFPTKRHNYPARRISTSCTLPCLFPTMQFKTFTLLAIGLPLAMASPLRKYWLLLFPINMYSQCFM